MKRKDTREKHRLRSLYMKQFYRGNRLLFAFNSAMMVLLALFNLLISWLMQKIIDTATGNEVAPLVEISLTVAAAFAAFVLVYAAYRVFDPKFRKRAMLQYKQFTFDQITKKSISSFFSESTGKYISALTNDVASIETNYLSSIFTLVNLGVAFLGSLALMIYYSPVLTAVAVALSVVPVAASLLTGNRLAKEEKAVSERNEAFVGSVKDLLTGFPVIKSFKAELEAQKLFARENERVEDAKYKRRVTAHTIELLGSATGIVAQMGVFLFGGYLAITGNAITPGVVIVFVQLMNFVLAPIQQVPPILANRKAALQLVDKLAEAVNANVRRNGKTIKNRLDSGIEIKDLTFAYDKGVPVLEGVSLTFEAGKSYAVVGGSGSGKSTLLNLLMGSYDKYEGEIRYDGEELREISADSLYELISLVQQNVFVFNDTIRNNITLFREFPDEKVAEAIKKSGLAGLIETMGEDYICGENGSGLSGGEKQRISIARALLQGTPVMLIDEATAALDAATAFEVTSAILDIGGLTRIVVTHRLEEKLLLRYDEILVLRSGTVCEKGTFQELMNAGGLFYSLFTVSQSG